MCSFWMRDFFPESSASLSSIAFSVNFLLLLFIPDFWSVLSSVAFLFLVILSHYLFFKMVLYQDRPISRHFIGTFEPFVFTRVGWPLTFLFYPSLAPAAIPSYSAGMHSVLIYSSQVISQDYRSGIREVILSKFPFFRKHFSYLELHLYNHSLQKVTALTSSRNINRSFNILDEGQ
jgi:hypothetical protein